MNYNEFMAQAYRDAFDLGIPYPEEVVDWFYDKLEQCAGSRWAVAANYGLEGYGWPENWVSTEFESLTQGQADEPSTPTSPGVVTCVEVHTEVQALLFRVAGRTISVRGWYEEGEV